MIILALDLGKFNTMCCIYNSKTRKHEFINATTERNFLTTLLKKTKCDLVVMEACGHWQKGSAYWEASKYPYVDKFIRS